MNHNETPCHRCGDGAFPVQCMPSKVYLCIDCWRWFGALRDEVAIADALAWQNPCELELLPVVMRAAKEAVKFERGMANIKRKNKRDWHRVGESGEGVRAIRALR